MESNNDLYIKTYKYLKQGLSGSVYNEKKTDRLKRTLLPVLRDYYNNIITLKEASEITHELYSLSYFSFDLTAEDPDLFAIFDILGFIAIKNPKTKLMRRVKSYYLENYNVVMHNLSGDLKTTLKESFN